MSFLRYILLLIILGGGILFCIRKLRFSQSLSPLLAILGNSLILYVFSLLNFLLPGAYILAGANLVLGILAFIDFPKQKKQEKIVLSPAIFIWVFIFIILIGYTRGLLFYAWDEFSYWGVISKYLLATNHLPDQASNFLFIGYPPFLPVFHYFVAKIIGTHESSAYFAQMLMSFSALIAIFPNLTWKNWRKFILFFAVSVISVIALDNKFQSLYVDLMIGLFFAASLVSIDFDEDLPLDRFLVVLFSSTALAIIKPLGILFSLFSLSLLFYKFARINFQSNSPGEFWRSLSKPFRSIQFLLVLALPILAYFSWSIHTAPFNNEILNVTLGEITPPSTESALPISDQELILKTNHLLF